jgi:hypothetical protein
VEVGQLAQTGYFLSSTLLLGPLRIHFCVVVNSFKS